MLFRSVMHDEILQLQAPRIYINTGAETIIPPIDGVKDNPLVYTSTSIMELKDLPEKLIIVGGGYIGLEFASMFASFGSQVVVLEGNSELISREDRDIASAVKETLEKKGIVFCLNAKVQSIREGKVGMGVRMGAVILAEIGDFSRFDSPDSVCSGNQKKSFFLRSASG